MIKLRINSPFIIANLVLVPLYFSFTTYFFFRGNSDAYDYVDTYLKQSKVIKLTIPKLYEEKKSIINSVIQKGHITAEIIGNLYSIPPNIVNTSLSYRSAI